MNTKLQKFISAVVDYFRRSDGLLLALCTIASIYGIVLIESATRFADTQRYVVVQVLALLIGIGLYLLFSIMDLDIIADKWRALLIFSVVFISSLFVFGVAGDTGNRAWLRFGGIGVQPAEIVKIPFIIILAKQISYLSERDSINSWRSVVQMLAFFGLMFVLIIEASSDMGSALVYFFIFAVMLFVSGLSLLWFAGGMAAIAAVWPLVWTHVFTQSQRDRILSPYDSSIDPSGLGITWQTKQSCAAISRGGFSGMGLFGGEKTQVGGIPQQHTDFIFSVAGEELGFIGCTLIIVIIALIIIRCINIGMKSSYRLGSLVCFGCAAMLIFQTLENIGMCIGLTPVIGLTLPFFSYGGSSIITLFAAMGIVSGVKMRPQPSRFIQLKPYG